jgi:hypothetical protein
VTIKHCITDELTLLLKDNMQILTAPRFNFDTAEVLDPAIAIPYKIFEQLKDKITLVNIDQHIDPEVKKLMDGFNTSSKCDISTINGNIYNTNLVTAMENPNHPERAYRKGLDALVVKPGASGSIASLEGKNKDGTICLNPKLIVSHGADVKVKIDPKLAAPANKGSFPEKQENQIFSKPLLRSKTILKNKFANKKY